MLATDCLQSCLLIFGRFTCLPQLELELRDNLYWQRTSQPHRQKQRCSRWVPVRQVSLVKLAFHRYGRSYSTTTRRPRASPSTRSTYTPGASAGNGTAPPAGTPSTATRAPSIA